MNNKIIIFSSGFNCAEYVSLHLNSIYCQTYTNYLHIIVDDASTDNTDKIIRNNIKSNSILINNKNNLKFTENIYNYLYPKDEDIIVIVDLDDWLYNNTVLSLINHVYNTTECWLTYGSFIWISDNHIEGSEYSEAVRKNKLYRKDIWRATHLKTFKGFLWNRLNKELLKYTNGLFYKSTGDQVIMFPMLEMCKWNKIRFIDSILYCYNNLNPLNDSKVDAKLQVNISKYLTTLPVEKEIYYD